jgi:hypothetical protein
MHAIVAFALAHSEVGKSSSLPSLEGCLTSNYTDCLYRGENAYLAKPCEITTAEDFVQALNLRPIHNLHASPCFGGVYMLRRLAGYTAEKVGKDESSAAMPLLLTAPALHATKDDRSD